MMASADLVVERNGKAFFSFRGGLHSASLRVLIARAWQLTNAGPLLLSTCVCAFPLDCVYFKMNFSNFCRLFGMP